MVVYLDHAASTPVRPEVVQLFSSLLGTSGNPSAVHSAGQKAKATLEQAREDIAALLGANRNEVVFTSGGTEANNLAVLGLYSTRNFSASRTIVLCLGTEHHAVLEAAEHLEKSGANLVLIPVSAAGQPDTEWLEAYLAEHHERVALVAAIWANNETGTVIDLPKIAEICKRFQIPVHTDAVAAVGHLSVDFKQLGVDTLAFTGHKIGAPVGIGALLVARGSKVAPRAFGGSQERAIRPGTQDVVGAAALAEALRLAVSELPVHRASWERLRARLIGGVMKAVPSAQLAGEALDSTPEKRIPNIVNLVFPGCAGESLLFLLDSAGVAISNGSACNAGVTGGSHVLQAMGWSVKDSQSAVRLSFGVTTTEPDIEKFLAALPEAHRRALIAGFTS